ncbi:MAG: diguanylate cyclase [Calditrichia bacterium]
MNQSNTGESRKPRILVVDDEQSVHKLLRAYLVRHDYDVRSCLQSREVIEKIVEHEPDLILLDLMMPELDGIAATKRIRNQKLPSYLPIIVLTAKKEKWDMVTALEAGADDYITKPFDFDELLARIKNMLRIKSLQDTLVRRTVEVDDANKQISRLNSVLVKTNKQLQRKLYDFHNLFEVSYRVMGQLEFPKLVRKALVNILGIFGTRNAVMMQATKADEDFFSVIDSRGMNDDILSQLHFSRHSGLIHYLELQKKALQLSELPEEFADVCAALQKAEIEVVSPMLRNDDIIGMVCLGANFKGEPYSKENLETLGILTNMLSVATHNAQNYERLREMSYTDGMTGLHNYRFFRLRLKEELARARRESSSLSLLIMDVDHFKNYNDTLGHPAGDDVLRKVSNILKKSVRDNDIVARYGGEEFAIILPRATQGGAAALAERIRVKVEEAGFFREEVQPMGKVTISVGLASFPQDAPAETELISFADQALYVAKKSGRNQVIIAKDIEEIA